MAITFAFDVYGTLVDPQAIARQLEAHLGAGFGEGAAGPFARLWRAKQLEYSLRRSLMGAYRDLPTAPARPSTTPAPPRVPTSRKRPAKS